MMVWVCTLHTTAHRDIGIINDGLSVYSAYNYTQGYRDYKWWLECVLCRHTTAHKDTGIIGKNNIGDQKIWNNLSATKLFIFPMLQLKSEIKYNVFIDSLEFIEISSDGEPELGVLGLFLVFCDLIKNIFENIKTNKKNIFEKKI